MAFVNNVPIWEFHFWRMSLPSDYDLIYYFSLCVLEMNIILKLHYTCLQHCYILVKVQYCISNYWYCRFSIHFISAFHPCYGWKYTPLCLILCATCVTHILELRRTWKKITNRECIFTIIICYFICACFMLSQVSGFVYQ